MRQFSNHYCRENIKRFILDTLSKGVMLMLFVSLIVVVLGVPSLIAMPYLLLLFLGLLVPNSTFTYILPVSYLYSILSVSAQYAFNIPTVDDNFIYPTKGILYKVGFRRETIPSAVIFGQLALTLLLSLTMRVRFSVQGHEHFTENIVRVVIRNSHSDQSDSDQESTSYDSDATENLEDIEDDLSPEVGELAINEKKKKKRPKTFRSGLRWTLRALRRGWEKFRILSIKFFTTYSYYLSLLVVYFADLTTDNADAIHAVYLLFFLLFFVFRGLAKRFWILLVIYTQFSIVSLYLFNVYYPNVVGIPYRIIGFVTFKKDSFWVGLVWHILILFFTSMEYHVQKLSVENLTEFAGIRISMDKLALPHSIQIMVRGVQELSKIFGIYASYLAVILLLLLSHDTSILGIVFFVLLFACFILQTYRITQILLYPFWYIVVLYSVIVFFAVYVYQFPDVRSKLDTAIALVPEVDRLFMDASTIGLTTFRYKSVSLLPYTCILLLNIFQLKNFQIWRSGNSTKKSPQTTPVEFDTQTKRDFGEEPKSLMSELDLAGQKNTVVFSQRIDDFLVDISRFMKRLSILHQPKLLLIFLFVAAQLNLTIIGLIYFFIVILLAPVPNIASRLWLFIYVYSSTIFLSQYIYQFPYFKLGLRCNLNPPKPGEPNPHTEQPHPACAWFKFGGLKLSGTHELVGIVLWVHVIVMIMSLYQKKCFQWQDDLMKRHLFVPGRLFLDEGSESAREEQIQTIKTSDRFTWIPLGVRVFVSRFMMDVWNKFKYICNHVFEDFGYEVCMLILLIGSLLMIQSVWGLLYLILFGICFFAGEKRMSRVWVVLVIFMELNMIVLYVFKLEKFPIFDLYAVLTNWKGSMIFKWVVLRPQDFAGGAFAADFIVIILYCILFFMALQTRVYFNEGVHRALKLAKRSNHDEEETEDPTKIPASLILHNTQKEQNHLHVKCPVPETNERVRDFTSTAKSRNIVDWIKLMVVFRGFPVIVLVVVFIDASVKPSFIKLLQMTICLFYINFLEQLRWRSKSYWRWLGIFYYCALILQAVYQIPVVMVGTPLVWQLDKAGNPTKAAKALSQLFNAIGLKKVSITDLWLSILVLVLFYIQDKIFDLNPDYLFFLNFLTRQRDKRKKLRIRNKTFRAAQIFRRYVEITFIQSRRKRNMEAIKAYETGKGMSDEEKKGIEDLGISDPKIIKEYGLREHYVRIHKAYAEDGSLSQKSEREIFRIAFENIRNSRSLQDDIIDHVDQKRMEELYNSSKKQLERQQRLEQSISKRSKTATRKKKSVTMAADVKSQPQDVNDIIIELPPSPLPEHNQPELHMPVQQQPELAAAKEEAPSFTDKLAGIINYVWILIRGYIIWGIDMVIFYLRPYINIAYGTEENIVEWLSGSSTGSDQKALLENREKEQLKFTAPKEKEKEKDEASLNTIQMDEPIKIPEATTATATSEAPANEKKEPEKLWYDVVDPNADIVLVDKFKELGSLIKNLYYSNTDLLVYAAMVVNSIYSPTIYNMLFTTSAFMYAAMQYPFPPRIYWLLILGISQAMIAMEYIMFLIQSAIFEDISKENKYSPLELIGWKPRTSLLKYIGMYLLVILAVLQHRDTLKKRGDWYYAEETKKKLLKRQKKQGALDKALKEAKASEEQQAEAKEEKKREKRSRSITANTGNQSGNVTIDQGAVETRRRSASNLIITVEKPDGASPELVPPEEAQAQAVKPNIAKRVLFHAWGYFKQLTNEHAKLGSDYFVVCVGVQLVAFLFFFLSFSYMSGRPSTDITGAIQSNELSGTFVLVLFLFFVEICVERVIYLYSKLWPKLIFHYILVITYHVIYLSMYNYVMKLNNVKGAYLLNVLFVIKCLYLGMSSVQIRNGYPATGIYSSFFAKSYFWIQYYIYLGWRAIPFVFELKTLLDWTFIPTTLNFYEWMKMEDVYSELYNRKCDLEYRNILGRNYGVGQYWTRKLFAGFLIFCVVSGIIFFPLLFYSTANPSFDYNTVSLVKTQVAITGYQSFYENQYAALKPQFIPFQKEFGNSARDYSFSQFDPGSAVQQFNLNAWSEVYWIISTPSRESLVKVLNDDTSKLNLTITYEIDRAGPATAKTLKDEQVIPLTSQDRADLAAMISAIGTTTDISTIKDLTLKNAFNPFILNKYSGMTVATRVDDESFFPTCTLGIRKTQEVDIGGLYYWLMNCTQVPLASPKSVVTSGPYFVIQSTMIVKDSGLTFISGIGIIAFYTTFVLTVGQFLRMYVSGLVTRIHFEDVDNVDLLLSFVKDVYIARENGALDLEETMYLQLMRIYRDTTLLQVWTNINRSTL
jgi:hypothetical protein